MELFLPFGAGVETVVVPNGTVPDRIGRAAAGDVDVVALLGDAFARPAGSPPLPEFLRGAKSLLVVVNDATRATPTGLILDHVREQLATVPDVKILVATGLHRAPTEKEYRTILGPAYDCFRKVSSAHDGNRLETLEWISGGRHEILVNPALAQAERILVINSVEPHFFAGYTGGRKSFLPGLAGYPSVEKSHAGAVSENAAPLRIADNPVRDFIESNTGFINPARVFAVQTVLDRFDKIARIFVGNLDTAFGLACAEAHKFYTMAVNRRYEIVLAVVQPPLDINLYQTEKAWEHARGALKAGGVLICVSACREGIGSTFYRRLGEKYPDHSGWLALAEQPYEMGLHKLVRTARMRAQGELWLVSEMDDDIVRSFWYEPKKSIQTAIDEAFARADGNPRMLVIDDAALTVPVIDE